MSELLTPLLQYGVLGIFSVLLLLFAKDSIKRERATTALERARAEAAETEVKRLNALIADKTIPALVSATQAIGQSLGVVQAVQYQRDVETAAAASAASPKKGIL